MRTILLEVSPLLNGVPLTLRMSGSASSSATTQINGYQWLPCITKRHTRSASWAKDGILSTIDTSWGTIEFWLNRDFNNEVWTSYEWSGAQARIFTGEEGQPFTSYTQVFEGNVSSLDRTGNKATIALLGSEANLTVPLLNLSYGGTGGADGMVSMKGQLKPRAFGNCKTVAPVLVDGANYIYQVHGYGAVTSIPYVYEYAQALDSAKFKGNFASYADLAAATLQPAEWATCLAEGMFRLGGAPRQKVSADVVVGNTDVASIAKQMFAVAAIPNAKIGSLSQFASTNWSLYLTDQSDVLETLRGMFFQAGGYIYADGTGVWQVGDYYAPSTTIVINEDRSTLSLVKSIKELNANGPVFKVNVGFDRCWDVHSESDVSPALSIISDKQIANDAATAAAREAAQQAATDAKVAKDRTDAMVDDGKLDRAEKQQLVQWFSGESAQQTGLQSQSTLVDVSAERATLTTKFNSWKNYLEGLSPAYTDTTQDTAIDRVTFNARQSDYEIAKQDLLNKIAGIASTTSNYSGIADDNGKKPADNATVGGTIGKDIKNADGTVYVPPSKDQLVDTVAPAVPTGLAITSKITDAGATMNLTWNAVSDSDLAGYNVAIKEGDGNYIEFTTGSTSYTRDALPRNTKYTAKVSAYDKAGNESGFSTEVTATTAKDDVPPSPFTISGVDASYETAFVTVTAPADKDIDRLQLDLYIGNNLVKQQTVKVSPSQTVTVTLSKLLKATTYAVGGFAYDTSGNTSTGTPSVSFTTAGGIDVADFTPGLAPIKTVTSLPSASGYTGPSVVLLQSDGKLYRYVNGAWTKEVGGNDITAGAIDSTKLNVSLGGGNLLRNSGFENTVFASTNGTLGAGFAEYNNGASIGEPMSLEVQQNGRNGGWSQLVKWTAAQTTTKGIIFNNTGGIDNTNIMKANSTYILSYYARGAGGATAAGIGLRWNKAPTVTPIQYPTVTDQWQRWVWKIQTNSNVDPNVFITTDSGQPNGYFYIDDIQLEEGDVATAYKPALLSGEVTGALVGAAAISNANLSDNAVMARNILAGEIKASHIAANAIATNKLTVATRPFSIYGTQFYVDNNNVLQWSAGYVQFVPDDGGYSSYFVSGGSSTWGGAVQYIFYRPGDSSFNITTYEVTQTEQTMFLVGKWFGDKSKLIMSSGVGTMINGDQIVTGSIDAQKVKAQSITADQIQVGAIGAAQIAVGAIRADKLAVGATGQNMIANCGQDGTASGWYLVEGNAGTGTVSAGYFTSGRFAVVSGKSSAGDITAWGYRAMPVVPGKTYVWRFNATSQSASRAKGFYARINYATDKGSSEAITASNRSGFNDFASNAPMQNYDQAYSFVWTCPGNTYWASPAIYNWATDEANALAMYWSGMEFYEQADSTSIQDGAIITSKIMVNSLNGDRIQAGTLSADKLTAGTVLAGTIQVGTSSLNDISAQAQNGTPLTFTQYQGIYTINGNRCTKTGGGDQWDYNAWVDSPMRGSFILSGKFTDVSTFIGVRPSKDLATYPGFNYSWHRSADGNWYIFEGGNSVYAAASFASRPYTADTVCRIEYAGNVINYWADDIIIRSVAATPNTTWWAGFAIARPGSSLRFLTWSGGNDNSLINTDPAARINGYSTNIDPGKITVSGSTTLASWRYGGDNTKIEGGALGANTVSANKLTVGNRGIGYIGINFEWNPNDNRVYWTEGYIYYTNDAGTLTSDYVAAGNTNGAAAHQWFYWSPGQGIRFSQDNPGRENVIMLAAWWGGSNLNVTYGGTIINGDRITTNTINANRIIARTITSTQIQAGSISADRLSVGSLSAISANIGTLVSYNGAGGRIERDGNGDRGYYNNGVLGYEAGFLN